MPLDGHDYLVSQGWGGKGTGLREGAISRPIAVSQKKNLAGLGKDRDEAFPFWDHLFSAAASAIKVSIDDSDDEGGGGSSNTSDDSDSEGSKSKTAAVSFNLTTTGIISNRRPPAGTPATSNSGTSTPDPSSSCAIKYSLMTIAKRDAARRGLYSRFFRGPVLGPDTSVETKTARESSPVPMYVGDGSLAEKKETTVKAMMKEVTAGAASLSVAEGTKKASKEKSRKSKGKVVETITSEKAEAVQDVETTDKERRKEEKAERKKARAEKRARKEAKRALKAAKEGEGLAKVEVGAQEQKKAGKKEKRHKSDSKGKQKEIVVEDAPANTEGMDVDQCAAAAIPPKTSSKKKTRTSQDEDTKSESIQQKKVGRKAKRPASDDDSTSLERTETSPPPKKKKRKHEASS